MGFTFQEVEENGLISEEVLAYIPRTCECGAEIEFTDTLKQIYCSNPKCIYKIAARIESMAKAMKADGWGESTCVSVCKAFNMQTPFHVFSLEKGLALGYTADVPAYEKKVKEICDPEKRKVQLWEVVKLAGIPSIETIAEKIFGGYNTMEEAYKDIEEGEVPFIAEKLGIKNMEASVMAVHIYNKLIEYKDELLFGEKQFTIYKPTGETIRIAITSGVNGFRNKSEFVKSLRERYNGAINPILMNSVTKEVDILVADGNTDSSKYRKAVKINEKYRQEGSKDKEGRLHPAGESILIGSSTEVIKRLDEFNKR